MEPVKKAFLITGKILTKKYFRNFGVDFIGGAFRLDFWMLIDSTEIIYIYNIRIIFLTQSYHTRSLDEWNNQ